MEFRAHSKINLGLDVIRRREDGYHELRMIMQTLELSDIVDITVAKPAGQVSTQQGTATGASANPGTIVEPDANQGTTAEAGTSPRVTMTCSNPDLPCDDSNLCVKAAKLLMEEFNITDEIHIHLEKNIPIAAGMAGGSTDGAAVLEGLNEMYNLGLSSQELQDRGVTLGADIPYCIMKGTALAEGIGDKLTRLPSMVDYPILIAKPKESVSTGFVYKNLKIDSLVHPDIDGQIEAIRKQDVKGIASTMGNVLETVTISALPVIDEIKKCMCDKGAINSMMSGSGPTVFGIFPDKGSASDAMAAIQDMGCCEKVMVTEVHNV